MPDRNRTARNPTRVATGLDKAIAAVWDGVTVQRCTVHKHRNLLAHAPERLHEELTADYTDVIYAATREEIEARRKAFIRKWRLKHRAVADSLEEAGDRLFTSLACHPASGVAQEPRTRSSGCMKSSSDGSRPHRDMGSGGVNRLPKIARRTHGSCRGGAMTKAQQQLDGCRGLLLA